MQLFSIYFELTRCTNKKQPKLLTVKINSVKKLIKISLFFLIVTSCLNQNERMKAKTEIRNDTAEVFRILMDSAFISHYLPDRGFLFYNNPFGDSIILQFDSLFLKKIPIHDSLKFKILTKNEICELATKNYDVKKASSFPNFIKIIKFVKTSSGYEIALQNTCVFPNYINGERYINPMTNEKSDTADCSFGFLCGGTIELSVQKTKDGFDARITARILD